MLLVFFASLKPFQMSQYFDWYNSVLQVLIETVLEYLLFTGVCYRFVYTRRNVIFPSV